MSDDDYIQGWNEAVEACYALLHDRDEQEAAELLRQLLGGQDGGPPATGTAG